MAYRLARTELETLAKLGAAARLDQLERERSAILRAFPEFRGGRAASRGVASDPNRGETPARVESPEAGSTRRRRRSTMSAAGRRAVSVRMKKYWAQRRKQKGVAAAR